jgi:hypothetical protein
MELSGNLRFLSMESSGISSSQIFDGSCIFKDNDILFVPKDPRTFSLILIQIYMNNLFINPMHLEQVAIFLNILFKTLNHGDFG